MQSARVCAKSIRDAGCRLPRHWGCSWPLCWQGCGLGEGDMAARYPNGEVKVYNWGEYIDEELIDQFQEEYGIRVIYDTFTTNEEMFPKLQAEPGYVRCGLSVGLYD